MKLSGWGRYPMREAEVYAPCSEAALIERIRAGGLIARGNGRAYGDSAISHRNTVQMGHFNRILSFNETSGQLVAEAGVLLSDIIEEFLPRGWFPIVAPGTKFVTIGGMVAADVHGKNHHKDGSFRNCVDWFDLLDSAGTVRHCSKQENTDLFEWTLGGMGLTGIVLRAAIRMRPVKTAWVKRHTLSAANLDAAIGLIEQSLDATYSVAWIDCLSTGDQQGRSLVMLGEHATLDDLNESQQRRPLDAGRKRKFSIPIEGSASLLNSFTVRAFNAIYYRNGTAKLGSQIVDWDSYFFPLDALLNWNRIYGRRGFAQFQCVIPLKKSREGLKALLSATSKAGAGTFLAVLKRFGEQQGGFSFPMAGYTLAMDFPINDRTLNLMAILDQITLDHDGRFYLAKDSRMSAETLRRSDDRTLKFLQIREEFAARSQFCSAQSERLAL